MKVGIAVVAKELGVTKTTLRRWEAEGKIQSERTKGGHRRYDLAKFLKKVVPKFKSDVIQKTVGYVRVSSYDQKNDLVRQKVLLESYCGANGWCHEIIEDLGSGMNYKKKGLKALLKKICSGEVDRLVLTHKDRLLRLGSELVFALCEQFGVEIVIINASEESTFEEDLVQDVLEIITVFSARLYGARSRKNKTLLDALKEAATSV